MTRENLPGRCDHCGHTFGYHLIHNGFNESCYAYCAECGMTALMDTGYHDRADQGLPRHRSITAGGDQFLRSCACGGRFSPGASPRCPHCKQALSATEAAQWIEANAAGSTWGWRWQRSWDGLYAIIIDDRVAHNPWRPGLDNFGRESRRLTSA